MLTLEIPEGKTQPTELLRFFSVIAEIHGVNCWIVLFLVTNMVE